EQPAAAAAQARQRPGTPGDDEEDGGAERHPSPGEDQRRHAVVVGDLDEEVGDPPEDRDGGERAPGAPAHLPGRRKRRGAGRRLAATREAPKPATVARIVTATAVRRRPSRSKRSTCQSSSLAIAASGGSGVSATRVPPPRKHARGTGGDGE